MLRGSIGSPNVYRRVAEWGDGWLPFCVDPKEIADGKAAITAQAKKIGRNPAELEICAFAPLGMFRTATDVKALAGAGADNMVVWLDGKSQAELLAELEALAGALF